MPPKLAPTTTMLWTAIYDCIGRSAMNVREKGWMKGDTELGSFYTELSCGGKD